MTEPSQIALERAFKTWFAEAYQRGDETDDDIAALELSLIACKMFEAYAAQRVTEAIEQAANLVETHYIAGGPDGNVLMRAETLMSRAIRALKEPLR